MGIMEQASAKGESPTLEVRTNLTHPTLGLVITGQRGEGERTSSRSMHDGTLLDDRSIPFHRINHPH